MNKLLFLLMILFSSLCCNCQFEDREKLIAGENYKFWLKSNGSNSNFQTIYYFDQSNVWLVFQRNNRGDFFRYDGGDVFLVEKWHLINDSIVNIGNGIYNILEINTKSFKYKNDKLGLVTLVPAPEGLIPKEFDKAHIPY